MNWDMEREGKPRRRMKWGWCNRILKYMTDIVSDSPSLVSSKYPWKLIVHTSDASPNAANMSMGISGRGFLLSRSHVDTLIIPCQFRLQNVIGDAINHIITSATAAAVPQSNPFGIPSTPDECDFVSNHWPHEYFQSNAIYLSPHYNNNNGHNNSLLPTHTSSN